MSIIRHIFIPPEVTVKHRAVVQRYIEQAGELPAGDWPLVIETFNLLRRAVVVRVDERAYTFAQVYAELVDTRYATTLIKGLLDLEDVEEGSIPLWAAAARRIYQDLTEIGLHVPDRHPESRLLMSYCLYWWQSFCKGYAFEIEVFRDLERSGLHFQAHDLLDPGDRRSAHDLLISGLRGDVKSGVHFLLKASREAVSCDFIITRVWLSGRRARTLVVFLQDMAWERIDGETLLTILSHLGEVLPKPARIAYHNGELVVADYADWKRRMSQYQQLHGGLP
jgi:hypothetical protein